MIQFDFLQPTRKYDNEQLYGLNKDSKLLQKFKDLDHELGMQMVPDENPVPAR